MKENKETCLLSSDIKAHIKIPPRHSAVPKRQEEASAEGVLCSHPPERSTDNQKKKAVRP